MSSRNRRARRHALVLLSIAVPAAAAPESCGPTPAATLRFEPAPIESGRRVLLVGPGRRLDTPSAAAREARDGDVVLIDAADYPAEHAVWQQTRLLLRGVNGRPRLIAGDELAQDKAIWVVNGNDVVIENIEFSSARNADHNGAGIRAQGGRLTIRAAYFHDSDTGLLTDNDPGQQLTVEFSEFARNGYDDGRAHNLYVGSIARFELRYSSSSGARTGHLVKSRAKRNVIAYNQLADIPAGPSSYELDFPRSTDTTVIGNLIAQSGASPNATLLSYGAEDNGRPPEGRLRVAWNTFYSARTQPVFIFNHSRDDALVIDNLFGGATGQDIRGRAQTRGNRTVSSSVFVDPAGLDFRLRSAEIASWSRGQDERDAPVDLRPAYEYVAPQSALAREPGVPAFPGAFGDCGGNAS
jgi:hypothetical protein